MAFEIARVSGGTSSDFLNRAPGSGAGCVSTMNPTIFGQAQLRLSSFARQFKDSSGKPTSVEVSICDTDNYPAALDQLAATVVGKAGLARDS